LRFASSDFNLSLSWNLNPKAKTSQSAAEEQHNNFESPLFTDADLYLAPVDFDVPWNLSVGMVFNYRLTPRTLAQMNSPAAVGGNPGSISKGGFTHNIISTVTLSGNITITPKWKMTFGTGLDVVSRKMTFTSITFSRDLHCWDMSFYWVPFGYRTEWNFHIRIRSSVFSAIKYEKRNEARY
jgi:hypothetical protein